MLFEFVDLNFFICKMEEKIKENMTKGGWKNKESCYLISKLCKHQHNLIMLYNSEDKFKNNENMIEECIHIANYAMMIYMNSRRRRLYLMDKNKDNSI